MKEAAYSEMLIVTNQTTRYKNCNFHFYRAEKLLSRIIGSFVLTDCALQCSHYKRQPFAHVNVYLTNKQLTPWSVVHLEKLRVAQSVKKLPVLYGTWRFIIVL
jgi:hypothetical protein